MTARESVLRFEQVGERQEWTWFFVASNGEMLARCSETHPDIRDAIHSARIVLGGTLITEDGRLPVVNGRPDVRVEGLQ